MKSKAVVQIVLFITSFVIIFTYIKPAYTNLQAVQAEASEYAEAINSADQFNSELKNQLVAASNLTTSELNALNRYLPSNIDSVSVMRDIEIISNRNTLIITDLSSTESQSDADTASNRRGSQEDYGDDVEFAQGQLDSSNLPVESTTFALSAQGTYVNFKTFLHDLERSAYPLEISKLTVLADENDEAISDGAKLYTFDLELETYKLVLE